MKTSSFQEFCYFLGNGRVIAMENLSDTDPKILRDLGISVSSSRKKKNRRSRRRNRRNRKNKKSDDKNEKLEVSSLTSSDYLEKFRSYVGGEEVKSLT